jgi:hypothetical protein
MMIVVQLGLAIIPLCPATAWGFTSGTTKGTLGSIRKHEELSTTTHPAAAATGANFSLMLPPALNKAISRLSKQPSTIACSVYDLPMKSTVLPASSGWAKSVSCRCNSPQLTSQASATTPPAGGFRRRSRAHTAGQCGAVPARRTSLNGKSRFSIVFSISIPTAPLAPAMAMLGFASPFLVLKKARQLGPSSREDVRAEMCDIARMGPRSADATKAEYSVSRGAGTRRCTSGCKLQVAGERSPAGSYRLQQAPVR